MFDMNKLPERVQKAIRRREGLTADDTSHDTEFASLTAEEAFREYCEWNGMRGWADDLIAVWRACEDASS